MKSRTFLTTLVLFLFFFNLGIVIICISIFNNNVNSQKEKCLNEHYFIVSGLAKDFYSIENRNVDIDSSLDTLFKPYKFLYENKNVTFELYKNDEIVYSNNFYCMQDYDLLKTPENENRISSIHKIDNKNYIVVSGKLPSPYESYSMVYFYDITDIINSWNHMKNKLFLAGLILSMFFAFGLFLLLNRIFKPLSKVSEISHNIANGEYETRLEIKGNDELSQMAQSFNNMADEIQRQILELTESSKRKQQFIDSFAHELKTPLTAIYGYAEYMQKANMSEDDRLSALNFIMSESQRLQELAFQLLELANLRNNQLVCKKLKLPELFSSINQTLKGKLLEKNIRIEYLFETEYLFGDICLLESLFINLIDNAIKACSTGGHIQVKSYIENEKIIVSIEDNGKGMSSEVIPQITEPFYRAEKSRNRKDGGTGLGLALCKQIVDCHNANLEFISYPEKGTKVKITFTTL